MTSDNVTAMLAFNQDVRGGVEPAGTTIALRVTALGFFDTGGLGGAGQLAEPIAIERVALTLLQHFEREDLRLVLDQIAQLREALAQ